MYHTFFQWGTSQEARAQIILAGLKNSSPDISRASAEVETASKGKYPHSSHNFLELIRAFISYFIFSPHTHITLIVFHLFIGADEQPADNFMKVAALGINTLFSKTSAISKGILYNVQQTLLKEWGSESLCILPEDTIQELLTGVISIFHVYILFNLFLCLFLPILSSSLF